MDNPILVIGSEGMVGSRFLELSENKEKFHSPRRIEFDMTDASQVNAIFKSYDFPAVINFAAFTNVDAAEKERENKNGPCWVTNVEAIANVAQAIANNGKKTHLIHISTDMVFPGDKKDKGPYQEDHKPGEDLTRLTWYGYTKAEGERTIRNILGDDLTIIRIIFPVRVKFNKKLDLLRRSLEMYDGSGLYPVFSDQQISISFVDEICEAIDKVILDRKYGNFHISSEDTVTPFELISYLIEKTRGATDVVKPEKVDNLLKSENAPAYRYAKYRGLKVEETERALGVKFRNWKQIVDELVIQGIGKTTS